VKTFCDESDDNQDWFAIRVSVGVLVAHEVRTMGRDSQLLRPSREANQNLVHDCHNRLLSQDFCGGI
jgi:kynurenine formamidase